MSAASKVDLYDVLGLRPDALRSEIRTASQQLKKKASRQPPSVASGEEAKVDLVEAVLLDDHLCALYHRARTSRRRGSDPRVAEEAYRRQQDAIELRRKRYEDDEEARKEAIRKHRASARDDAQACQQQSEAMRLSKQYAERRDFERAIAYSERSCELGGREPYTLNHLAALLRRAGRPQAAEHAARESVQRDSSLDTNAPGWTTLAAVVRGDEGAAICRRILERRSTDPYALNTAGALAVEAGLYQEAEAFFEKAARQPTGNGRAVTELAALRRRYLEHGDDPGAERVSAALGRLG